MTDSIPAGFQAGYIAVEASACGEDLIYWVLNQQQMDEAEQGYQSSNDYCETMGDVIDNHNLLNTGARCGTIKEALEFMLTNKMILVEDFNYIGY